MDIRLGLTFDDVLLLPGESEVLPSMADTRTQLTRSIIDGYLSIPAFNVNFGQNKRRSEHHFMSRHH